jgi:hypothetical protein
MAHSLDVRKRMDLHGTTGTEVVLPGNPMKTNSIKRLREERAALLVALRDCVESLRRLPDSDGAWRVSCIQEAERAIKLAKKP